MRPCDRFQGGGDVSKLSLAQPAGEMLTDPSKVGTSCLSKDPASRRREPGEHHSSVPLEPVALDVAGADEPVDHPCDPARRHHHSLRKLGHPEATAGSPGQPQQYVVFGHRKLVLGSELGVQRPDDLVMGVQERLPRPEFRFIEVSAH